MPNAYLYPVNAGWAYACPACYLDAITSPPDPEEVFAPDFRPVDLNGDERQTCEACGVVIPEPEDE